MYYLTARDYYADQLGVVGSYASHGLVQARREVVGLVGDAPEDGD